MGFIELIQRGGLDLWNINIVWNKDSVGCCVCPPYIISCTCWTRYFACFIPVPLITPCYNPYVCNHQRTRFPTFPSNQLLTTYIYHTKILYSMLAEKRYLTYISNLNFKLKFQTQTWISKTKIFPVLPGNPGFWEIDSKGKRNEIHEATSCYLGKAMSWSRVGTEGF